MVMQTALADPVGGLWGLQPPLNFQKNIGHPRGRCDRLTRVAFVIDLVVTSSNNACLCSLNGACCLNETQFSHDCLAEAAPTSYAIIATSGSLRSHDPERV